MNLKSILLNNAETCPPWNTPCQLIVKGAYSSSVLALARLQQPDLAGTNGEWPDRLYQGSTVALDYRTGELVWWAQHHSDMWNDDSIYDRILVDVPVNPDPPNALGIRPNIDPS